MKKLSLLSAAIVGALALPAHAAQEAGEINFHGYGRAGVAYAGESGDNPDFNKNKLGRLGNEADKYFEIGLGKEVANVNGVSFYLDTLVAFGNAGNNNWEGSDPALRIANVKVKGLFEDKDAILWAGQDFYKRKDIHITDFYYLDTSAGAGFGLADYTMGPGKLSLAVSQENTDHLVKDDKEVSGVLFDARYAMDMGLEFVLNYHLSNETDAQTVGDDGMLFTAEYTLGLDSGFNKTVFQFGTNGYGAQMSTYGGGGWYGYSDDTTGYRLINWGVIGFGDNIELGHQLVYGASDLDGADQTTISAVVRPVYKWDEISRTILEMGYFKDDSDVADSDGYKFTVAQAWAAGDSFWARPELRVYASYLGSDGAFQGEDSEYVVGAQVEVWW